MLRLTTVGRKTGKPRAAMLGYIEDGPNLVTLAMNGWASPEPAWWLNLQARPDAVVETVDGRRPIHGRAAIGEERERLWTALEAISGFGNDLDAFASRRAGETAVVVRSHAPADVPAPPGQATAMTILPRTVPDSTWATAAAASSNG